jgi:xanthine dehydrogenase accessory factor
MNNGQALKSLPVVVVRGCGDVGSAVAHALYLQGADVIVSDEPAPAHPRRGMAFTDGFFETQAELEGVLARRAPEVVARADDDPVWLSDRPLDELLRTTRVDVFVDARMRKHSLPADQRGVAPTVVGLGPGFDTHRNCDLAIETAWGDSLGRVVADGGTSHQGGEPRVLGGAGRERFFYAHDEGTWHTGLHIGEAVEQGQIVGRLGDADVRSPLGGVLRGLSHDGARVAPQRKIVEVDPRIDARVTGLGERPRAIAQGVLQALDLAARGHQRAFAFEHEHQSTLRGLPMGVRLKLDLCGIKPSLQQWRSLPIEARRLLVDLPVDTPAMVHRVRCFFALSLDQAAAGRFEAVPDTEFAWQDRARVPQRLQAELIGLGIAPLSPAAWSALDDLQRFALFKLARRNRTRHLAPALREFGLG